METKSEQQRINRFIFTEEKKNCYAVDKQFRILLIIEWIFGIFTALYISPKTWIGSQSLIHTHLLAAIFLGGFIVLPPILLGFFKPGHTITRYSFSVCQMLFGCLLIHLMGGRLEAHFYLFGSLAFLSTYRKWKVLIPATLIVLLDHIIRGYYWPQSIYGVVSGAEYRWIEHALWLVFEDIFLVIAIKQNKVDLKMIASKTIQLENKSNEINDINKNLESEVSRRTKEAKDNAAMAYHNSKLAAIGSLAAGVGHEINNPLMIIHGNTNTLSRAGDIGSTVIPIKNIQIATKRRSIIVNGLRDLARRDADKKGNFNLVNDIEQTIMLVRSIYENEGISLETNYNHLDDVKIYGNSGKVQQVFMNLLANAKDSFKEQSNKRISITIEEHNETVLVKIEDNGSGIPREIQTKIFDAFFTTKPPGEGTGIGLSMSNSIIRDHGGTIRFESDPQGTTFFITLPTVTNPQLLIKEKTTTSQFLSEDNKNKGPWADKHILVIDDEELVREVICDELNEEKIKTTAVASGKEALETLLKDSTIDLIFCDLTMPKMSGIEFVQEYLKTKSQNKVKVVFVTGGAKLNKEKCKKEGIEELFQDTILKPFDKETLVSLLKNVFTIT